MVIHCVESNSKYLGVNISDNLSWHNHIQATAAKSNRTVGFLRRNLRECTPKVKAATYQTMANIRPIVEYAATVWDPTEKGEIQTLEKVQRNAARFVLNNYTERTPGCVTNMVNSLKWEPLEVRRRNSRLQMLYRITNNLVDLDRNKFFKHSDRRTRGAQRIHQEHSQHPILFSSFFPRTIRDWNSLPTTLTNSPSLEAFRSGLSSAKH